MSLAFSRVNISQLGGDNLLYRQTYNPVLVTACPLTPCLLACDIGHRLAWWLSWYMQVFSLLHAQWRGDFLSTSCLFSSPGNPLQGTGLAAPVTPFPGLLPFKLFVQFPWYVRPIVLNSPLPLWLWSRTQLQTYLELFSYKISAPIARLFEGNSIPRHWNTWSKHTVIVIPPSIYLAKVLN